MIFAMLFVTNSVVFAMIFVMVPVPENDIRYVIRFVPIFTLLFAPVQVPENDIHYVIHFAPIFALLFALEQIYMHLNVFQESAQCSSLELGRL